MTVRLTQDVYEIECYFPTWAIPKDHKVTKALEEAYTGLYGEQRESVLPRLSK